MAAKTHNLTLERFLNARVCLTCSAVFGPVLDEETVQRGCCGRTEIKTKGQELMRLDFPTCIEICGCCGFEAIESGSRYSWFFCEACLTAVKATNEREGFTLIPPGRHSFMSRTLITADQVREGLLDAFLAGFIPRVRRCCDFRNPRMAQIVADVVGCAEDGLHMPHLDVWKNAHERGPLASGAVDVPIGDYMETVRAIAQWRYGHINEARRAALDALFDWMVA